MPALYPVIGHGDPWVPQLDARTIIAAFNRRRRIDARLAAWRREWDEFWASPFGKFSSTILWGCALSLAIHTACRLCGVIP